MNAMQKSFLAGIATGAMLLACAQAFAQNAMSEARVIVKYKADSAILPKGLSSVSAAKSAMQTKALAARTGLALDAGPDVAPQSHVVIASGMTSQELADRL